MTIVPVGGGGAIVQNTKPPVKSEGKVWIKPVDGGTQIGRYTHDNLNMVDFCATLEPGKIWYSDESTINFLNIKTGNTNTVTVDSYEPFTSVGFDENYVAFTSDSGTYYCGKNNTSGTAGKIPEGKRVDVYDGVITTRDNNCRVYDISSNSEIAYETTDWISDYGNAITIDSNYIYMTGGDKIRRYSHNDLTQYDEFTLDNNIHQLACDGNNIYAAAEYNGYVQCLDSSLNEIWRTDEYGSDSYTDLLVNDGWLYSTESRWVFDTSDGTKYEVRVADGNCINGDVVYSLSNSTDTKVKTITNKSHFDEIYVSDGNNWLESTIKFPNHFE